MQELPRKLWYSVLNAIGPLTASDLKKAFPQLIGGNPSTLVLRFASKYQRERAFAQEPARIAKIAVILRRVTGEQWRVQVESGEGFKKVGRIGLWDMDIKIRQTLQDYFNRNQDCHLAALLGKAQVKVYPLHEITRRTLDVVVILSEATLSLYDAKMTDWAARDELQRKLQEAFIGCDLVRPRRAIEVERKLQEAVTELLEEDVELAHLRVVVVSSDEVEGDCGLNNCFFKTERTIAHDELRFRSQAEVTIYDELCKRKLLFFPNAAAVLGGEQKQKREPDFLICYVGKWGILEVMGDEYHKNAAKDHDRARLFKDAGVLCVEFFSADVCRLSPSQVIDKFLSVLAQF